MQLFQSWRDSIKFFAPANIKLFGLLVVNTTVRTLSVWLRFFWPLFLISIVGDVFPVATFKIGPVQMSLGSLIGIFAKFLLIMTLFLSVRPSVRKKTYSYFLHYKLYALFIGIFFFAKVFVFQIVSGLGELGADLFVLSLFSPFYAVGMTLFMLFYLDSRGSFIDLFLSGWRTAKMIFFGLPFFLIVVSVPSAIFYVVFYSFGIGLFPFVSLVRFLPAGKIMLFVWSLVKHLFILLSVPVVAVNANFYTKRLHDQFKLYFRA